MPLILTNKANLIERVGSETVLDRYARQNEANIDRAILVASDMFRSAAINQFTEETVDLLNEDNVTPEVQFHIESLALDNLTTGQSRPEDIGKFGDRAREWLSWLAGGKVNVANLTRRGSAESGGEGGGLTRRRTGRDRVIDRNSDDITYDIVNPRI